jgi:Serine/threonine protein kinase
VACSRVGQGVALAVHRELWSEARPLFEELVKLDSARRESRLHEIGRTAPALRETLESLLIADASGDDPLHDFNFSRRQPQIAVETNAPRDPLGIIGQIVSHFRVTGFVATGGMGVVYKAEDLQLARTVALKFPAPHHEVTEDVKERFVREARAAAALDHPSVCSVHEIGDSPYGVFLAMPLYRGETLKDRLARERRLPTAEAIGIIRKITTGLKFAHAAGVIHRDLKPGNLILLPDGSVKILDFGLAKVRDISRTRSNARLGTVSYMAPEQIRGESVDARADLWAVGVILYELVTGVAPFGGEHELAVLHGILHTEPRRPSDFKVRFRGRSTNSSRPCCRRTVCIAMNRQMSFSRISMRSNGASR